MLFILHVLVKSHICILKALWIMLGFMFCEQEVGICGWDCGSIQYVVPYVDTLLDCVLPWLITELHTYLFSTFQPWMVWISSSLIGGCCILKLDFNCLHACFYFLFFFLDSGSWLFSAWLLVVKWTEKWDPHFPLSACSLVKCSLSDQWTHIFPFKLLSIWCQRIIQYIWFFWSICFC